MESQPGSTTGRWYYDANRELSAPRLAAALVLAALVAAAASWLLGGLTGLSGGWLVLVAAIAAAALIHVAIVWPLLQDFDSRLDVAEGEIADTVQRLRAAKARPASMLTDEVTMLPNQRALTSSLIEHMAHAERYGNPLSVAYVELGDFEQIKTHDGAGPRALKAVAEVFADTLRMPDKAGRCDDHTFLVVLPHTKLKDANAILERLRRNVATRTLDSDGEKLKLAVRVSTTQFRKGDDLEKLLDRARQPAPARPAARKRAAGKSAR